MFYSYFMAIQFMKYIFTAINLNQEGFAKYKALLGFFQYESDNYI